MTEPGQAAPGAQELIERMPFAAALGIVVESAVPGEVTGRLPWSEGLCTMGGILHGGALMSLADTIGAICAFLNLPSGATTATISSSTSLLRAVRSGDVLATARPLSTGRTVIVVRTDLHDAQGRLAAQVTQAQAVLPARP
jgi:uncharacterized protein (TIGR00369 family)